MNIFRNHLKFSAKDNPFNVAKKIALWVIIISFAAVLILSIGNWIWIEFKEWFIGGMVVIGSLIGNLFSFIKDNAIIIVLIVIAIILYKIYSILYSKN